ncbi:MAG: hypothetical protein N3A63_08520 [Bacteroidetes bacterium]|nr:hypothetical protein [Bacteroidota bacterium]
MYTTEYPTKSYTLLYTTEGPEFIIQIQKQWYTIVFMIFWLIGWGIAEYTVLKMAASNKDSEHYGLVVWLILWTLAGGVALVIVLWLLFGTEHIVLHPTDITIYHKLFFFKRSHTYDIASIRNLRVEQSINAESPSFYTSRQLQPIAFEYQGKTYRFGNGISSTDASEIVEFLRSQYRFP